MVTTGNIVVAIPVKNEEAVIRVCVAAHLTQTLPPGIILLLLNNCTDLTLNICQKIQSEAANLKIVQCELPAALASAGEARRLALDHAARLAGNGLILTTDADALPDNNWIADNVAEIAAGADVVCGKAEIDETGRYNLTRRLEFDDMREKFLHEKIDEIVALADPDPADPWPRHQQNSGASIAVKATVLQQAGGAPHVASGEDRALIERLRLVDARIRHAPHIKVNVSGRLEGRAPGGMAETLRRRIVKPDALLDEAIEPVVDAYRRAKAKAALRAVRAGRGCARQLAEDLLISPETMRPALDSTFFGTAWDTIQRASPVLHRRRVSATDLARETRQALALLDQLKSTDNEHARNLADAG